MYEYDCHMKYQAQMKKYIESLDEAIYQIDKMCEKLSIEEADLCYFRPASTVSSPNSMDPPPPKKQAISGNLEADGAQPTCSKYLQPENKPVFIDVDENDTPLKLSLSPKYVVKIDSDEEEVFEAPSDLPPTISECNEKQNAAINYSHFESNIRNKISVPAPRKKFVLKKKSRIKEFDEEYEKETNDFSVIFD